MCILDIMQMSVEVILSLDIYQKIDLNPHCTPKGKPNTLPKIFVGSMGAGPDSLLWLNSYNTLYPSTLTISCSVLHQLDEKLNLPFPLCFTQRRPLYRVRVRGEAFLLEHQLQIERQTCLFIKFFGQLTSWELLTGKFLQESQASTQFAQPHNPILLPSRLFFPSLNFCFVFMPSIITISLLVIPEQIAPSGLCLPIKVLSNTERPFHH